MSSTSRLTSLNILNVLAYIINAVVTFGIGVSGLGGFPTNAELSEKYQTLVTPIGAVFSIWAIIFISQFIFVIAQLLSPYRQEPLVTKGVGRYYIGACLAQAAWTVAFTYEVIWLSLIFMLSILYFLVSIVVTQYKTQEKTAILDYWLLKFPFAIHCGWIIAASFVNLCVVFVAYGLQAGLQYYYAFATVGCVFLIAVAALRYPNRPEYVIPVVLAWATIGIYLELRFPKDSILATFGEQKIENVKFGAITASLSILLSVLVHGVRDFLDSRRTARTRGTAETRAGNADRDANDYVRHDDDEDKGKTNSKTHAFF